MPLCCVKWCRSHSDMKTTGLTFHMFPTNKIRREKWITAVRLERNEVDWIPTKNTKICSIHFCSDDMYMLNDGRRIRIKKSVVPICTMVRPLKANIVKPSGSSEPSSSTNSTNVQVQERDPFAPEEEDYTVVVKEEFEADEVTLTVPSAATSDISPKGVTLPSLIPSLNVRPSSSSVPGPPLMTVVGDEMQIFANSVAEQLRAFPLDRALLLQLEIQTMLDNERQLLIDSN